MKAWQYNTTKGGIEKNLFINPSAAIPKTTKPDQHVVQILSVSLNPVDYKPADAPLVDRYAIKKPASPGIDFVGRIVTPAADSPLKPGQMVFGLCGLSDFAGGALAEYNVAEKKCTVPVPAGVDPEHAATIGIAGVTAYQSILTTGGAKPGDRVFLNGGSGGVGTFGIQIAKASGLHVTTSCSTRNVELCRSLGADEVIDYTKGSVLKKLQTLAADKQKFDLVVDNVGSDMTLYWQAHTYTKPSALYVNIAGEPSLKYLFTVLKSQMPSFLGGPKRKMPLLMYQRKYEDYEQIAKWMQEGKVKAIVDRKFAFADAPAAFERSKTGRTVGKILIDVAMETAGRT